MILLKILAVITAISLLGMLYWKYKARKGTLVLSTKSLHFKFMKYCWDIDETDIKNACPYYWAIVATVLMFPLYSLFRYFIIPIAEWITKVEGKINFPHISIPLPKIIIPETKKQWFKLLYSKGKDILETIFIGLIVMGFISLILVGSWSAWHISPIFAYSLLTLLIIILIHLWTMTEYPEYNYLYIDQYKNFLTGLWGIISLPFKLIWFGISWLFSKIFKIASDNCPPIEFVNE